MVVVGYISLFVVCTALLPSQAFNLFDKVTCDLPHLKIKLDTCTRRYEQPVSVFLPPSLVGDGVAGMQSLVSSTGVDYQQLFVQVDEIKCLSQQRLQRASQVECRYAVMTECVQPAYRSFLPYLSRIKEGMEYICDHLSSLDAQCETGRLSQVIGCVKRKDQTSYTENEEFYVQDRMCRTFEYARQCVVSSLAECGQTDVDIHSRAMDYFAPSFCSATHHVTSLAAILLFSGLSHIVSRIFLH
ncbi:uncharacterized protein LOC125372313 [Haliotis rufescens]|uniref:uncharacterized protein LOC125372313 n=1 Tax=Haliotis rufescens TaxID=6454 RepID=UPI00201EA314|nr:uncharacterized protein LOC125372313 [Haliotis rufescens]